MSDEKPLARRFQIELNALGKLFREHPRVFALFCVVALSCLACALYEKFWGKTALNETIHNQKEEITSLHQQLLLAQSQLAPFKTIALEKYPGRIEDALTNLTSDLQHFESRLTNAETQIRTFDLEVSFDISATWKAATGDATFFVGGDSTPVVLNFVLDDMKEMQIAFQGAQSAALKTAGNVVRASYKTSPPLGSQIYGMVPDRLRAINNLEIVLLGLKRERLADPHVKLGPGHLTIYVNGRKQYRFEFNKIVDFDTSPYKANEDLAMTLHETVDLKQPMAGHESESANLTQ